MNNWYQFFTFVKIEYQFITSEKKRTSSSLITRIRTNSSQLKMGKVWKGVEFEHRCKTPKIIEIDHTQISHFPKVTFWYQFFTRCEICEMWNLRFNKASTYNRSVDQRKAQTCMGFVFRINVQDFEFNLWWLVCAISLFRSFVFSPGAISSWRRAITPGEKTKERNNEMAQTSHHINPMSYDTYALVKVYAYMHSHMH